MVPQIRITCIIMRSPEVRRNTQNTNLLANRSYKSQDDIDALLFSQLRPYPSFQKGRHEADPTMCLGYL